MKLPLRLLGIGILMLTCFVGSSSSTSAAIGPNMVRTIFGEGLHIVVSAPGSTYAEGARVPITVRLTNNGRFSTPIRWWCGQFAHLHFVTASRFVSNSTQDLGTVPVVDQARGCATTSKIGLLRPHHTWTARQHIILLRPHLAARIVLVHHNIDTPGTADEAVFAPVLNFSLLPGHGK